MTSPQNEIPDDCSFGFSINLTFEPKNVGKLRQQVTRLTVGAAKKTITSVTDFGIEMIPLKVCFILK